MKVGLLRLFVCSRNKKKFYMNLPVSAKINLLWLDSGIYSSLAWLFSSWNQLLMDKYKKELSTLALFIEYNLMINDWVWLLTITFKIIIQDQEFHLPLFPSFSSINHITWAFSIFLVSLFPYFISLLFSFRPFTFIYFFSKTHENAIFSILSSAFQLFETFLT